MAVRDQRGDGSTVVLRRQPARIVESRPEGGDTHIFEINCRECGDDPGQDYREVSPELQRIRGHTRSRMAWQHTRNTSRATSSRQAPPANRR